MSKSVEKNFVPYAFDASNYVPVLGCLVSSKYTSCRRRKEKERERERERGRLKEEQCSSRGTARDRERKPTVLDVCSSDRFSSRSEMDAHGASAWDWPTGSPHRAECCCIDGGKRKKEKKKKKKKKSRSPGKTLSCPRIEASLKTRLSGTTIQKVSREAWAEPSEKRE